VDGTITDYLLTQPAGSVTGFALSNVCEWLSADQIDELFAQVVRTAVDGARVCFRNFVGWTEVPPRFRDVIVEDRARGERLMARDRALVNRRLAICNVRL
jgi:S-adenosylmethionine-diacylglycerol 3-amino-3-carboxypropyl transferase